MIYRQIEANLHNLQPAIGEVNGNRGHYQYSRWRGGEGQYGLYEMKMDFKNKQAEPPARARDAIAQTYFYMRDCYQFRLSQAQTQLFDVWGPYLSGDRVRMQMQSSASPQ